MNEQFQISIPQEAINARVDTLVKGTLSDSKLRDVMYVAVEKHRRELIQHLSEDVAQTTVTEFNKVREKIIADFLESKKTEIKINTDKVITIDGTSTHSELPKLISYLNLFKQSMIVGPTGSGKSTLAQQAAQAMGLRYGSFSCNMEASKSELMGFANLNGYITSQFLDFYENGGVFLIDEYDAMSPSIAVVLNAVFDRTGQISVPNRMEKPVAMKHKDFYCILAGNTWGSGSIEYQGREMQDLAFLDRFKLCRIEVGYDDNIEKNIAGAGYKWFMDIRKFCKDYVESEVFSTRSLYDSVVLMTNGFDKKAILDMISFHWDSSLKKKLSDNLLKAKSEYTFNLTSTSK